MKYYSEKDINVAIPEGSMYQNFCRHLEAFDQNALALRYQGIRISYKKFLKKIDEVADALFAFGVKQGEIVAVCLPNIPEVAYLIFAINKVGAVANMLDPRVAEKVLKSQLNDGESRFLFSIDIAIPKFEKILSETRVEVAVLVSGIETIPALIKRLIRVKDKTLRTVKSDRFIKWNSFLKKANP